MTAKSARRFKALHRTAVDAFRREEYRLAADKHLEALEAAPIQLEDAQLTKCLFGWANAVIEITLSSGSCLQVDDVQYLERISRDMSEPLFRRAFATKARAVIHDSNENVSKAATLYRRAIALAIQVDAQERARSVGAWSIGNYLDKLVNSAELKLDIISEGPTTKSTIDSKLCNATEEDITHRLSTGGFECECCGETPEDLGVDALFKCSFCKLAFYCSKACQAKQWKDGHHDACRKYGEVSIGDWMLIHSCENRRDLNGKPVIVRWPIPRTEGRWHVEDLEKKGALLSIAAKNLRHMRPLH